MQMTQLLPARCLNLAAEKTKKNVDSAVPSVLRGECKRCPGDAPEGLGSRVTLGLSFGEGV